VKIDPERVLRHALTGKASEAGLRSGWQSEPEVAGMRMRCRCVGDAMDALQIALCDGMGCRCNGMRQASPRLRLPPDPQASAALPALGAFVELGALVTLGAFVAAVALSAGGGIAATSLLAPAEEDIALEW
jgi:cysteine sulfinate desulfinase/cysteine desulfurase-like protein